MFIGYKEQFECNRIFQYTETGHKKAVYLSSFCHGGTFMTLTTVSSRTHFDSI